jgi:hypothetical protein
MGFLEGNGVPVLTYRTPKFHAAIFHYTQKYICKQNDVYDTRFSQQRILSSETGQYCTWLPPSTSKMDAAGSSKTLVTTYQTVQYHNPENQKLNSKFRYISNTSTLFYSTPTKLDNHTIIKS